MSLLRTDLLLLRVVQFGTGTFLTAAVRCRRDRLVTARTNLSVAAMLSDVNPTSPMRRYGP